MAPVVGILVTVSAVLVGCDNRGGSGREPLFVDIGAELAATVDPVMAWGDYDSDGDLDLALAGYYWNGDPVYITRAYRNDSGAFVEATAQLTGVRDGSLAWGDYDGDGDLDLALAGNTGDFLPVPVTKVYENDGGGNFTDVSLAGLTGVYRCSLAWGDYDNDGDLDLALAGYAGLGNVSIVYGNDGEGVFTDIGAELKGVDNCSLAWGDYDNDGDLDLALAGGLYGGVFRNDGGGAFSDISARLPAVIYCSLAWGDYDNDGDLDLVIAGANDAGSLVSEVYRNDGSEAFTPLDLMLEAVSECCVAWGDYDSDGDLDLAIAGYAAGGRVCKIYRSDGGRFNWRPSAPTGLVANIGSGEVTFSWSPGSDLATPTPGLTYNLRVATTPGGDEVMPGMTITSPEARLIPAMGNVQHNRSWTLTLPPGTYHWTVQAIDTAFAGSPWAPEETFTVP